MSEIDNRMRQVRANGATPIGPVPLTERERARLVAAWKAVQDSTEMKVWNELSTYACDARGISPGEWEINLDTGVFRRREVTSVPGA